MLLLQIAQSIDPTILVTLGSALIGRKNIGGLDSLIEHFGADHPDGLRKFRNTIVRLWTSLYRSRVVPAVSAMEANDFKMWGDLAFCQRYVDFIPKNGRKKAMTVKEDGKCYLEMKDAAVACHDALSAWVEAGGVSSGKSCEWPTFKLPHQSFLARSFQHAISPTWLEHIDSAKNSEGSWIRTIELVIKAYLMTNTLDPLYPGPMFLALCQPAAFEFCRQIVTNNFTSQPNTPYPFPDLIMDQPAHPSVEIILEDENHAPRNADNVHVLHSKRVELKKRHHMLMRKVMECYTEVAGIKVNGQWKMTQEVANALIPAIMVRKHGPFEIQLSLNTNLTESK